MSCPCYMLRRLLQGCYLDRTWGSGRATDGDSKDFSRNRTHDFEGNTSCCKACTKLLWTGCCEQGMAIVRVITNRPKLSINRDHQTCVVVNNITKHCSCIKGPNCSHTSHMQADISATDYLYAAALHFHAVHVLHIKASGGHRMKNRHMRKKALRMSVTELVAKTYSNLELVNSGVCELCHCFAAIRVYSICSWCMLQLATLGYCRTHQLTRAVD